MSGWISIFSTGPIRAPALILGPTPSKESILELLHFASRQVAKGGPSLDRSKMCIFDLSRVAQWNTWRQKVIGKRHILLTTVALAIGQTGIATAQDDRSPVPAVSGIQGACQGLPAHADLQTALKAARAASNGGFNLDMWATVVNRDGIVCAVAFTGKARGDQWPGSRAISAQKANTANSFSLPGLALSTANLFTATQPGGSLYGLQHSNPVDPSVVYGGDPSRFGQANDPMVGHHPGGVNVFGGGLALYNAKNQLLGAIGVSGDSSCADHNIAWRTRKGLKLDYVPNATSVSGDTNRPDNIVFDIVSQSGQMPGISPSGWGHPACNNQAAGIAAGLPAISISQ